VLDAGDSLSQLHQQGIDAIGGDSSRQLDASWLSRGGDGVPASTAVAKAGQLLPALQQQQQQQQRQQQSRKQQAAARVFKRAHTNHISRGQRERQQQQLDAEQEPTLQQQLCWQKQSRAHQAAAAVPSAGCNFGNIVGRQQPLRQLGSALSYSSGQTGQEPDNLFGAAVVQQQNISGSSSSKNINSTGGEGSGAAAAPGVLQPTQVHDEMFGLDFRPAQQAAAAGQEPQEAPGINVNGDNDTTRLLPPTRQT
jgi:hypothetical protein